MIAALTDAGWTRQADRAHEMVFSRPGKSSGISAKYDPSKGTLYVFTDGGGALEQHEWYSPFNVVKLLRYGGDFKAAASDIEAQGFGDPDAKVEPPTDAQRRARERREREEREREDYRQFVREERERLIDRHPATVEDFLTLSPFNIEEIPEGNQWRVMIGALYELRDVLWIADKVTESGYPRFSDKFQTVEEWLKRGTVPGVYAAPGTFKPGSFSRGLESIVSHPYVVVECDRAIGKEPETPQEIEENRAGNLAITRWLWREAGWTLRALVDSGNKSFHGWFDHPGDDEVKDLAAIAEPMGIDGVFDRPAQPFRLPEVRHHKSGRNSRLIYLDFK